MIAGQERHTATPMVSGGEQGVLVVGLNAPAAQFYNQFTSLWSSFGAQPAVPRRSHVAMQSGGRVIIAGGVDASSAKVASAEVFNPNPGDWSRTGSMRFARSGHAVSEIGAFGFLVSGTDTTPTG